VLPGVEPSLSTEARQPGEASQFQELQALKQASGGPDGRRIICKHSYVATCSPAPIASLPCTSGTNNTHPHWRRGRQCRPPGWRGSRGALHQARDPPKPHGRRGFVTGRERRTLTECHWAVGSGPACVDSTGCSGVAMTIRAGKVGRGRKAAT
jgi:hypothetical protein